MDESSIATIWDATYIYIQKSSDYSFQRLSYSIHKDRNLLKIMMLVSTTGLILECFGPYFSNGANNDANIIKNQFSQNQEKLNSFFRHNDSFKVDRGFRDCVDFLSGIGFNVYMPNFLYEGSQHSSSEANNSRLVTK